LTFVKALSAQSASASTTSPNSSVAITISSVQ